MQGHEWTEAEVAVRSSAPGLVGAGRSFARSAPETSWKRPVLILVVQRAEFEGSSYSGGRVLRR